MQQHLNKGVIFTLLSALIYAIQAAVVKLSGQTTPLPVLVFIQSFVALVLILPIMLRSYHKQRHYKENPFKTKALSLHIWRSIFSLGISYFLFASLSFIPLVDGVLMANTAPFFVPFILLMLTKKPLQHSLWLPLVIGFIGILLILKPDSQLFNPYALIALGAGVSMALSMTMVRRLSAIDNSLSIVFYYFLLSTIIAGIVSLPFWHRMNLADLMSLIIIGALFFFVQYFLVLGLKYANAQIVSALYYANVIFAAIIGAILFDETSGVLSVAGIILTITSAVVIIRKQNTNTQHKRKKFHAFIYKNS
ncbi:MAG: DMT family transporter [Francisellaceae bacterium]